jgi:3'-5' exoribonuclease
MQTISALKEGDVVDEIYLVTSKQVATAKNGVTYLSLKLSDKTGEIDGRLWDNAEETAGKFEREDFARIKGVAAAYQGTLQIKMKSLAKVDDSSVDIANFLEASPRNIDEMVKELTMFASSVTNTYLRRLLNSFLEDAPFMDAFRRIPAAKALHHNYIGGLLEHVVELVALCRDAAKHFPTIDVDLLVTGAFLHDIGKVKELSVRKTISYTTEGRLLGHISLGYEMVAQKISAIPGFPDELCMLLKHIMLSHHGEYEYGSPKRPKIREAIIVNYLDDLLAKISNFNATLKKEQVAEGEWTGFSKMHDRYLYRQMVNAVPEEDPEDAEEKPRVSAKSKKSVQANESGKLPLDI